MFLRKSKRRPLKIYTIQYTKEARDRIQELDASQRSVVKKAIESLRSNPLRGKPLSHQLAGLRSLRTSDYRIIYRIKDRELIIIVVTVGHRRDVYRRLKSLFEKS
jgi:mRNA interferase RelE/StbE